MTKTAMMNKAICIPQDQPGSSHAVTSNRSSAGSNFLLCHVTQDHGRNGSQEDWQNYPG